MRQFVEGGGFSLRYQAIEKPYRTVQGSICSIFWLGALHQISTNEIFILIKSIASDSIA
jgi:GTP:adenosylcobinamide-phosphate guanylyltransferase